MSVESSKLIEDADFIYENTNTKILIKRNCPEIKIPGLTVGPFKEGKEYEVKFWIAKELEKNGIARFRDEEVLNAVKLYKLHWKESVQPAKQISPLSSHFYPRLRRYLTDLKSQRVRKPEKMKEYEKVTRLTHDIVNCRLKKIIALSSVTELSEKILKNLTLEERDLYKSLFGIINEWRSKILS